MVTRIPQSLLNDALTAITRAAIAADVTHSTEFENAVLAISDLSYIIPEDE